MSTPGLARVEPPARVVNLFDKQNVKGDSMGWQTAVIEFTKALRTYGYREATIVLYRHYLNQLARLLPRTKPWQVTGKQLEQALGGVEWGPSARKSMRTAVVRFYRWAHGRGDIDHDPTLRLPTVRVPEGKPRPSPEIAIKQAFLAADERTRHMLELGVFAGLRAGEISRVHTDDLQQRSDEIFMLRVHGKGGKLRDVPVVAGNLTTAILAADGWLFPNYQRPGTHLTPNHVSKLISRALPGVWTSHNNRHRFATKAYAGTRDLLAVSQLLGHASTDTTRVYVQMPDDFLFDAVHAAGRVAA